MLRLRPLPNVRAAPTFNIPILNTNLTFKASVNNPHRFLYAVALAVSSHSSLR